MKQKLGIIQSRGLGDLVIALPIADYYYKQDWEIYWPIAQEFFPHMESAAPWVNWIPMKTDPQGQYFYNIPLECLNQIGMNEIIPLYQSLTNHPEFTQTAYFQHTKFDQYKYIRAQVPFHHKWQLKHCISRNYQREQTLYNKLVTNPEYCIIHLNGSDHTADFDRSIIPEHWQIIEIKDQTDIIWNWLTILEKAQSLILVDSVFANIVDQLGIGDDIYFLPRSHIQLTPTLLHNWTWLENTRLPQHTQIFRSN